MAPKDETAAEQHSAWERDKLFGLRLDKAFPATLEKPSDPFLVIGAKSDGTIPTELGEAEHVSLVVQRLDENGRPHGLPFKVGTLASAIVEKMKTAQPGDFPAIVQTMIVKGRFDKPENPKTLVLQHVGDTDPSTLLDEFGISGDTLAAVDQLRPAGERIPY